MCLYVIIIDILYLYYKMIIIYYKLNIILIDLAIKSFITHKHEKN